MIRPTGGWHGEKRLKTLTNALARLGAVGWPGCVTRFLQSMVADNRQFLWCA